ncbi:hypothetical protein F383_02605 [Gossypium arboreum]|uniref:Uncharacterized protein n=1 Tax=Gossypium arboreum TaxID=29729 RepID=A0A0B0NPX7_GOSAR|nr:hypothetical protein F383_02605 [Gossypium arboreum]
MKQAESCCSYVAIEPKMECLIIELCLNSSYENEIKMCHDLLICV